jgi:hypothetical protein
MAKAFEVAVKRAIDQEKGEGAKADEPLEFTLGDDPTVLHIYPPAESQLAVLLSVTDGMTQGSVQISTFINLFMELLTEESQPQVKRRLLSRSDPLNVTDLLPVIRWAIEEAAGRPTESSPTSSPSPATNGQPSTARARRTGSTRSSSRSTASSTSSTATSSKEAATGKNSTDS